MDSISLEKVITMGDLSFRQLCNMRRLETDKYRPEVIFSIEPGGWPADWEGRTILGLTRLKQVTKREPAFLNEIVFNVRNHFNEKGYFGKILPEGIVDEQQLSGHNWLLRGLLEYYLLTGDEEIKKDAISIVNNLFVPVMGKYKNYPIEPFQRSNDGNPDGKLTGELINGWYLSTDIGCAFISLDGLSLAYEVLNDERIKYLLIEMIDEYSRIDFVASSMQAHATLSALRGILRFYKKIKDEKYLTLAIRIFSTYEKYGMTANFANYNWFNKKESSTEPCAIIDSYMVAMDLFKLTEEIRYFELAQKIYFSALLHAQRENGGFGCDSCVNEDRVFLTASTYKSEENKVTDAYWCCTMRGGEGLAEVTNSIALEKDEILHIAHYNNCIINYGQAILNITTQYPKYGVVDIDVNGNVNQNNLALFIPSYANNYKIYVNDIEVVSTLKNGFATFECSENCKIKLEFDIPVIVENIPNSEKFRVLNGFEMQGILTESKCNILPRSLYKNSEGVITDGEIEFIPLSKAFEVSMQDMMQHSLLVII